MAVDMRESEMALWHGTGFTAARCGVVNSQLQRVLAAVEIDWGGARVRVALELPSRLGGYALHKHCAMDTNQHACACLRLQLILYFWCCRLSVEHT